MFNESLSVICAWLRLKLLEFEEGYARVGDSPPLISFFGCRKKQGIAKKLFHVFTKKQTAKSRDFFPPDSHEWNHFYALTKINFFFYLTNPILVIILYITVNIGGDNLKIIVSNRSGMPIYEQIKAQIKEAIFTSELQEDDLLPSIRQLAKDLKISVITTTRAYNDLEEEGFVVNVQGKGCYVLPQNIEMARENALRKVELGLTDAISAAKAGKITKNEVSEMLNVLYKEDNNE